MRKGKQSNYLDYHYFYHYSELSGQVRLNVLL